MAETVDREEYCGLLNDPTSGQFSNCSNGGLVVFTEYYDNCRYDVCANEGNDAVTKELACESLATAAADCAVQGSPIITWRSASNCRKLLSSLMHDPGA